MNSTSYRPDIDGLRAVAVLPVIFFHLGYLFPGGFVGVDVFFVISGYLITRILQRDLSTGPKLGQYLITFYEKRARRILPALFLVFSLTTFVAYQLLLPNDFVAYCRSLIASNLFISNFSFWSEIGYFHPNSDEKPLLHTWSLSVEEQFYLLFPPLLFMIHRFRQRLLSSAIITLAVLSFALSFYTSYHHPSVSFFWSPCRAWELMAGAFLATNRPFQSLGQKKLSIVAALGIVLIFAGYFLIDRYTPFPGAFGILPVLGTAMVIGAGEENPTSLAAKCLSLPPMLFFGKISYSLYLWHWPIIVFYRYYTVSPINVTEAFSLLAITIFISHLSYKFVEQPFRQKDVVRRKWIAGLATVGIATFVAIGVFIIFGQGFPGRFSESVLQYASFDKKVNAEFLKRFDERGLGAPTSHQKTVENPNARFATLGDSHIGMYSSTFDSLADEFGESFTRFEFAGHPPILNVKSNRKGREVVFRRRFKKLLDNSNIRVVYVGARWAAYVYGPFSRYNNGLQPFLRTPDGKLLKGEEQLSLFRNGIKETIDKLVDSGKKVVLICSVPEPGFDVPKSLAIIKFKQQDPASFVIAQELHDERTQAIYAWFQQLAKRDGVYVVDPADCLRRKDGDYLLSRDGNCLYFDDNHLSAFGVELVAPLLRRSMREMLDLIE